MDHIGGRHGTPGERGPEVALGSDGWQESSAEAQKLIDEVDAGIERARAAGLYAGAVGASTRAQHALDKRRGARGTKGDGRTGLGPGVEARTGDH